MTSTNTMQKAPGACDSKGLRTNTNSADSRSHGPIQQAHDGKAIATQFPRLALAGHVVHKGRAFIQTLGYWVIQSAPYAVAIAFGIFLGVIS